jgi:hypothetical protein
MSGLDSDDIESERDEGFSIRKLVVALIILLLLSPGFFMIFVGASGLSPIVVLAMWVLLLPVVLLFVRRIPRTRRMDGSDGANEDDVILMRMYRHASQARRTTDPDKFCCSYCETVFDLVNAVPVEPDIFLCPKCGARLLLE